jgi:hypothetical protein
MESDTSQSQLVRRSSEADSFAACVEEIGPPQVILKRTRLGKLWTGCVFLWKWLLGAVFCLNPLSSILVVGWTYRLVRRSVLKQWSKRSEVHRWRESFPAFTEAHDNTRQYTNWPNWIVEQNALQASRQGSREPSSVWDEITRAMLLPVRSLWLNLKIGVQGIFNTWVLTMPGCLLWLFAWHAGWNNSFHKGYEQYWVGPLCGWVGVLLFMAAMLYVPMAQVRQAATGNWRAFYQFGLVRELIRRRWLGCLMLAALYSLISLPVTILKSAPAFFPQVSPELADMTGPEASRFLLKYFFWASIAAFPAYLLLRLAAARLYASGLLSLIQDGTIADGVLERDERSDLERLDLVRYRPRPQRHVLIRAAGWTGGRIARSAAFAAILVIWFTFVAQIFIGEFLLYHPVVGWLNQPLVQLPWFHFGPW